MLDESGDLYSEGKNSTEFKNFIETGEYVTLDNDELLSLQRVLEQSDGYRKIMSERAKALVPGFCVLRMSGEEETLKSTKRKLTPAVDEEMKNKKPYTKK